MPVVRHAPYRRRLCSYVRLGSATRATPAVGAVDAQVCLVAPAAQAQPEVISGLFTIFPRSVETTLRQRSPGAPPDARFRAVAFMHRFGSYLNGHIRLHLLVSASVFSAGPVGEAVFHPALDLERKTPMRYRLRCATAACADCTNMVTSMTTLSKPWTAAHTPAAGRSMPR